MIKILVLNSDVDGVGFFRLLSPHLTMNDGEFEVDIRLLMDGTLNLLDENFIKQYDIIIYNKSLPFSKPEYNEHFRYILKKNNVKLIFDIDDFWILNAQHLNYDVWKNSKSDEIVVQNIKTADHVITTTSLFAERISQENPNVSIIENAVNLDELQWKYNRKESKKLRFLWGGGISHQHDLRLLKPSFALFDKDFIEKSQLYMCGYDLRVRTPTGTIAKSDPRTNQWSFFEDIFSNNGRYIKNNVHRDFLHKNSDKDFGISEEFSNEFYQRRWTKPIMLFGTMYNEADVCLAPLKSNNMFNYYKSNLKVIEAGAHHCAIIASNFGPYTIDDIEGKNGGKQKGFLIDENDTKGWWEKMKFYSENPNIAKEHGENLFEYVKNNLSLEVVNVKRKALYKKIVGEKPYVFGTFPMSNQKQSYPDITQFIK